MFSGEINDTSFVCLFLFPSPVEVSQLADYSIHIRRPMCFETLKEKLEQSFTDTGSNRGGTSGYVTYGQFLKDLRLIFKNAKTYCAVHMEVDDISRTIYDAAVLLGDLMEMWIAKEFSVEVGEKVLLHAIKSQEEAAAEAKAEEARRLVEAEDEAYRKEVSSPMPLCACLCPCLCLCLCTSLRVSPCLCVHDARYDVNLTLLVFVSTCACAGACACAANGVLIQGGSRLCG